MESCLAFIDGTFTDDVKRKTLSIAQAHDRSLIRKTMLWIAVAKRLNVTISPLKLTEKADVNIQTLY